MSSTSSEVILGTSCIVREESGRRQSRSPRNVIARVQPKPEQSRGVRAVRVEPTRVFRTLRILSPLRMPFSPPVASNNSERAGKSRVFRLAVVESSACLSSSDPSSRLLPADSVVGCLWSWRICQSASSPDVALKEKGPSPFKPGPSSQVAVKLFLDLRLRRPCRRSIAFTKTLAASAIPPLDEARSQVVAPAIAANQLV